MPEIAVGDKAPAFELLDDAGKPVRLADSLGSSVVLFFYPEADTPGCTAQACSFRDVFAEFRGLDAVVFGVSPDPVEAQAEFRRKYDLPFQLLSDPGNKVASRYGSFGKKLMYGKEVEGTIRSSIIIGPDGRITSIHRHVRTEGNGGRMVEALKALER